MKSGRGLKVDSAVADIQGLNWNGLIDRSWCVRYAKNNIKGKGSTIIKRVLVCCERFTEKSRKSHSKGGTVPLENKYEKNFRFQS